MAFQWLTGPLKTVFGGALKLFSGVPQEMIARETSEMIRGWITGKVSIEEKRVDVRGQWLADMEKIEAGDPTKGIPQKPLGNIWIWHEKARMGNLFFSDGKIISENNFVHLMSKIPPSERPLIYPQLNSLSEKDFIQRMDSLEHDVLWQTAQRWWNRYFLPTWTWGKAAYPTVRSSMDNWLEAKVSERASRPLRVGHPILRAFAWGIGIPVFIGIIVLAMVFMFA